MALALEGKSPTSAKCPRKEQPMSAAKAQPILSPDAWRGLSALRVQPRGPRCGWGVSDGGCCGAGGRGRCRLARVSRFDAVSAFWL